MWDTIGSDLQIFGQALVAMVLGGVIGYEREKAGKSAGLRTHMLLCLSTMLFVVIGELLVEVRMAKAPHETINSDPVRILEAIVTGIAFIGAGTVFRAPGRSAAYGLTTAASMLCVAPIGVAVALHRYALAIGITIIAWCVLRVLGILEHKSGLSSTPPQIEQKGS